MSKRLLQPVLLLACLLLMGCANSPATPYGGYKFVAQHSRGTDWVLQKEREWTPNESVTGAHIFAGLEWKHRIRCPYVNYVAHGAFDQVLIGCSWQFGTWGDKDWGFYAEPAIVHQVDSETSWFLRTDQKQWQGHNPFLHLRLGIELAGFNCAIASGKSVFQGAPFESEDNNPDIYWTNFECGVQVWGKTGAFR